MEMGMVARGVGVVGGMQEGGGGGGSGGGDENLKKKKLYSVNSRETEREGGLTRIVSKITLAMGELLLL